MSPRPLSAACLIAVLLAATASRHWRPGRPEPGVVLQEGGVAYKWVDEQGVVHYGDNIPPQYAQQGPRRC